MKKRLIPALLCICVMTVMLGAPLALAVTEDLSGEDSNAEKTQRWTHTSSITLDMKRNSNKVTSSATIIGQSGTTRISASFTLERLVNGNYEYVDSWSDSSNSMLLSTSRITSNCPAGTYKLSVIATVTRNGTSETVSDSIVKTL